MVLQRISLYGNCIGWTKYGTAMTTDAFLSMAINIIVIGIVIVGIEATLANARLALNTAFVISFYYKC
jgi:hypothetical protein